MGKQSAMLQLRFERGNLTVSFGKMVSVTIPLEAASHASPSRVPVARARKGNGQFANESGLMDQLRRAGLGGYDGA
jgi:hypothetical protein